MKMLYSDLGRATVGSVGLQLYNYQSVNEIPGRKMDIFGSHQTLVFDVTPRS